MEDISSLIWLGVVIVWFLTRLVRRGVKKATRSEQSRPRPAASPPASRPATRPTEPPAEPQLGRFRGQRDFSGRGGTGPPPIVPR